MSDLSDIWAFTTFETRAERKARLMSDPTTAETPTTRENLEKALWKEMTGGSDDMWNNGISQRGKENYRRYVGAILAAQAAIERERYTVVRSILGEFTVMRDGEPFAGPFDTNGAALAAIEQEN